MNQITLPVMASLEEQSKPFKIVDLLLNRVTGFNWYYFDMNLNQISVDETNTSEIVEEIDDFLTTAITGHVAGSFSLQHDYYDQGFDSAFLFKMIKYVEHHPALLKKVMSQIFDMNVILNGDKSATQDARFSADSGKMGKFNRKEKKRRNKRFHQVLRKQPDFRSLEKHFIVLAEGDSWFCFPKTSLGDPVKDIIDHLIKYDNLNVYSLASGGDWLFNMLDENGQEYVEGLSKICPDVFLVSGGGNDLVSNHRIAQMVRTLPNIGVNPINFAIGNQEQPDNIFERLWQMRRNDTEIDKTRYRRGLELISENFLHFVNICMVQYFTLFFKLLNNTDKFKQMLILTQGYDFAIPSKERKGSITQRFFNRIMNNGKWLYDSLVLKGIDDPFDQQAVVYFMIYEFNEMLSRIAQFKHFPNVFHMDIRGFATEKDWFDELHLKSKPNRQISAVFKDVIEKITPLLATSEGRKNILQSHSKVIRVKDYLIEK